ncbi:MAG TPA: agmatine deiminase family protein [Bacteroidia bacterium]|nr:agmatine deiminase family protein [Bacteroidia bacterium]
MAPTEPALMPGYLNNVQSSGITTPPASPVRTAAEWEEIQAITITWTSYQSVLREIVRAAQLEAQVYIVCNDSVNVKNYLTAGSVPLVNLHFIYCPYNSVWIRDYGQNTAYTNDVDSLLLVDWIYNRPRPKDDTIPDVIARRFGIPLYETTQAPYDVVHTGGNFMSDGLGTAFSSELVLNENPGHTEAEIDSIMKDFMGINRYVKMEVLPYDGIHHIDMHIKLLDEQTLLVGQYPQGVADGPQIEANLQYVLSTFMTPNGTPYKVIRIPMPPDQFGDYPDNGGYYCTYANATFINKTVILPLYYQQYDTTAIRIWEESLPGYNIVGINCNSTISASGALHCITHSVGTNDPLLISHFSLPNTTNDLNPYQVDARIQHRSGISTATLYWTTDTSQAWQMVSMSLTNAPLNTWTGFIPAQPVGTKIYYYISATSVSGKTQVRPMPAPAGWWMFEILGPMSVSETAIPEFTPAYPNPSHGLTCIPLNMPAQEKGRMVLIDMTGREVMVIHEGTFVAGEKNYFLNSDGVAAGAYQVVLTTDSYQLSQPLMVR